MTNKTSSDDSFPWLLILLGAILLLPSLAFPTYTDHATFLRGGEAIFDGAVLYRDFIDVKPPIAFVLFGVFESLVGYSEVGLRVADLIWQLFTLGVVLLLMRSLKLSYITQSLFVVLFSVTYVTLQWSQTIQMETLSGLPLALVLLRLNKPSTIVGNAIIGFLLAFMFLMKYTLGVTAVVLVVHTLISNGDTSSKMKSIAQWTGFSALFCVVLLLPFLLRDGFIESWKLVLEYTATYASNPPLSLDFLRIALKKTAALFGDNLSLLVCGAAVFGAFKLLASNSERNRALAAFLVFLCIGLLATVVMERKFVPYHFSRMYLPMTILASIGMSFGFLKLRSLMSSIGAAPKIAIAMLLAIGLLYSPLPRYTGVVRLTAASFVDPLAIERYMERRTEGPLNFTSIRAIKDVILEKVAPTDRVMVMSVTANMITASLFEYHHSQFADSHIYFAEGAPEAWKVMALKELRESDWLMVDTEDVHGLMTLHERTSYESVLADERFANTLYEEFILDTTISSYRLYKRVTGKDS